MAEVVYLLDVNVLSALVLADHRHHKLVTSWFASTDDLTFATCVLTEAGLIRVMTNPRAASRRMEASREALAVIARHPRHRFWPTAESAVDLTAPFADRLFGHQQLTDALLLGLAVRRNGVLVTLDAGLRHLAGTQHRQNLLVLES